MKRADLHELHYITPIENLASIMRYGLLSKHQAKRIGHKSIAMEEIQEIRANKKVPGGRPLHEYVNLYFSARNPMLYKRKGRHAEICVLRVSTAILDLPSVIIADGNAASEHAAFWPSPEGLKKVDGDIVFAEYWPDIDQIAEWKKKRVKKSLESDYPRPKAGAFRPIHGCATAISKSSGRGLHPLPCIIPARIHPRPKDGAFCGVS